MNNIKVVHVGEYVQGGVATYIKYLLSSEERIQNGNLNLDEYLILSKSTAIKSSSTSFCSSFLNK